MKKYILLFLLIFIASTTSGCVHTKATEVKYLTETALPADDSWRCAFKDSEIIELIELALKQNADILTANLNVDQADAELKAARLSWAPSVNLSVEGSVSKANGVSASYGYNVPVTMAWEANIYGQLHQTKASEALFWSTAERVRAVQIQIIASIASQYYTLQSLNEQRAIVRQNIEHAQTTMVVMEALKEAGIQNDAAISQARSEYLDEVAADASLKQQIRVAQNALKLLIGPNHDTIENMNDGYSDTFEVEQNSTSALDELPVPYDTAVPLNVLSSRPDVRAAEYELTAMIEGIEVAVSAFYPTISISASLGWTNNLGEYLNPGKVLFSMLGSIVQPLFNKGQNIANLRVSKARKEQALIAFHQALLTAGSEVAEALIACQGSKERMQIHVEQNEAAQHAYDISLELMKNGDATYLEVLTAQKTLLQNKLALATDRLDIVQGQINLYKALGGTGKCLCNR